MECNGGIAQKFRLETTDPSRILNVTFHSIVCDCNWLSVPLFTSGLELPARPYSLVPPTSSFVLVQMSGRAASSTLSDRSLRKSATARRPALRRGVAACFSPSLPRGLENGGGAHFHLPIADFIPFHPLSLPVLSSGAASVWLTSLQFSFLILMDAHASLFK